MRNDPREAGQDELEEESSTHCPLEWVWLNTAWPSQPVTSHACVLHRDSLLAMSIRGGVGRKDTCTPLFPLPACQD